MSNLKNEPVSPVSELDFNANGLIVEEKNGLTKRQYFAAKAMQGYMANSAETEIPCTYILDVLGLPKDTKYIFTEHYPAYVAKLSVLYADALLDALNK